MFTRLFVSTAVHLITLTATVILYAPSYPANPHARFATPSAQEQSQPSVPRKFDQYGQVGECDEGARLDNFAIQLQNEPTSKGYIISYDGRDTLPARLKLRGPRALNYLTYQRGLSPDRVVALDGGYREEVTIELWIVPKDAPAPEPSDTIVVVREAGKTFKYNEAHPEGAVLEYWEEPFEVQQQEEETVATQQASVEEPAQTQEAVTAEPTEAYDYDTLWASEEYAQALGEKSVGYIIYYAQRDYGHLFKLEQIIERGQNLLVNKYGVPTDRIKVIFGGYKDWTTVELWVIPPGGEEPAPTPEYEKVDTGGGTAVAEAIKE